MTITNKRGKKKVIRAWALMLGGVILHDKNEQHQARGQHHIYLTKEEALKTKPSDGENVVEVEIRPIQKRRRKP